MSRTLTLVYGAVSYLVFLGTFVYAVGFIGNFGVPTSLDAGRTEPWPTALAIDLALLALFGLQHSVMARQWFKRLITRVIPHGAERSTYVLASSLALLLLFAEWRPLGGVVWDVQHPVGRALLHAGFGAGWLLVLTATFVINHFDLFGLRQSWTYFRGRTLRPLPFTTPFFYRVVRHPLYVGWFLTFWCTPTMSAAHLLFAGMASAYILVAIQFEERDLVRAHPEYASYRQHVPMIVPRWPSDVALGTGPADVTAPVEGR
jgi:protein-S-isoprenylcysteine O-methyltransferase Ste14